MPNRKNWRKRQKIEIIKFFIPGKPKELQYRSSKGHIYCPKEVRSYQERIGWLAKLKVEKPTDKPIKLHLDVYVKKGRTADLSNYLKGIENALQGIVYKNDKQVEQIYARRIEHAYLEGAEVKVYV